MPNSMTGFGRADVCLNEIKFLIEIKSVNSRYLETSVRLPANYSSFENDIRLLLKSKIFRGKVDVTLREIDNAFSNAQNLIYNKPLLDKYIEMLRKISKDYSINDNLSVNTVSNLLGVFCLSENNETVFKWKDIKIAFEDALKDFLESRQIEGKHICSDILNNISLLKQLVLEIEDQVPNMLLEYEKRLSEKLKSVFENSDIDDTRVLMEIALFTDRTDVSEELARLSSHIASLEELLSSNFDVGRKCDFILQEINREINTIGSKTKSIKISEAVIESKTIIEKIREQVQNLE
ncbi:MAG: YicC family protein [Oscillospiraceae bacterium]|nr:YicC family protein [Oscillospiraceae bacterium]